MILHTIAPLWLVASQAQDPVPQEEEMDVPGGLLLGRRTPEGFLVSRVVSTDPAAYLREGSSPGSIYGGTGQAAPSPISRI